MFTANYFKQTKPVKVTATLSLHYQGTVMLHDRLNFIEFREIRKDLVVEVASSVYTLHSCFLFLFIHFRNIKKNASGILRIFHSNNHRKRLTKPSNMKIFNGYAVDLR